MWFHTREGFIYCVLWHISSFTLIKAVCNLHHNNFFYSVGSDLMRRPPFICCIDKSWSPNDFSVVDDLFPLFEPLLVDNSYNWMWSFHTSWHFGNALTSSLGYNDLAFILNLAYNYKIEHTKTKYLKLA